MYGISTHLLIQKMKQGNWNGIYSSAQRDMLSAIARWESYYYPYAAFT